MTGFSCYSVSEEDGRSRSSTKHFVFDDESKIVDESKVFVFILVKKE